MSLFEINSNAMRGSGFFFKGRAGENMLRGKLVYKAANGAWYLADADLAATTPTLGLTMDRANGGQIVRIMKEGYLGRGDWTWTVGGEIYTSAIPGELTQVPPVAPALTQVVGMATRPNMLQFDPSLSTSGATLTGYVGDYTYMVVRIGANYTVYDNQGAVASGPGADADVQINWALNAAGAGGVVYLKEGATYAIDDPIAFTANNQVLRGGGRGTFIDGDGLATTEHGIVLSAFTDCQILDLSIQTENGGGKTCHCIFIEDGADRFLIDGVTIVDSDDIGIKIEGTTITDGWIEGCTILGSDSNGIVVDMDPANYAYNINIVNNTLTAIGTHGILVSPSAGFIYGIIEGNVITGCVNRGISANGDLYYSHIVNNICHTNTWDGIFLNDCSNAIVEGNTCYSNGRNGIGLGNCDFSIISNNDCYENDSGDTATYDGINLDANSTDNIIEGNQCTGNHRYGIAVLGVRNKIIDNKCETNDRYGIYVAATDCQINDNDCYDNGQDAAGTYHEIYLTGGADRCQVHDNHISSPGDSSEDCIHLVNGAIDVSIMNNYCYNGMGSGIALMANNDNCSIIGNRCIDNDDYGIEIVASTCNDNRVKENHLEGNVTGQFLDNGTDTQTPWIFVEVSTPDSNIGTHPALLLTDEVDVTIRSQIPIPLEFQELVTSSVIIVPGGTGNMRRSVATNWGKLCSGEAYNVSTDALAAGEVAVDADDLECIDISAALTGIAGGDLVGIEFTRVGTHANDTVGANCYYLGIRVRYV